MLSFIIKGLVFFVISHSFVSVYFDELFEGNIDRTIKVKFTFAMMIFMVLFYITCSDFLQIL